MATCNFRVIRKKINKNKINKNRKILFLIAKELREINKKLKRIDAKKYKFL